MDKTVAAQINTDMRKGAVKGVEKNQVAGLKFCLKKGVCSFADRPAVAWQHHASYLPEYMAYETTAIESRFGRIAPETIGAANQADGIQGDIFRGRVGVSGRYQQQG